MEFNGDVLGNFVTYFIFDFDFVKIIALFYWHPFAISICSVNQVVNLPMRLRVGRLRNSVSVSSHASQIEQQQQIEILYR